MKTFISLSILSILFIYGCKKGDNNTTTPQSSPLDGDTAEYISFVLTGDSFNHETFVLKKPALNISANFAGARNIVSYSTPANGFSISAYLYFTQKTPSTLPLDTVTNRVAFIISGQGQNLFIEGIKGSISLEKFPETVNMMTRGTFEGTFVNIYAPYDTLQIDSGVFNLRRTQ